MNVTILTSEAFNIVALLGSLKLIINVKLFTGVSKLVWKLKITAQRMKWNFDKRGHHYIPCYLFLLSKSGFFQSNLIFILSNSNVLYRLIKWKNAKYQQIAMLIVKRQMIIWADFKDDFTIIGNFIKSMPIASISFDCQIYCKLIFFWSRIKFDPFFSI